MSKEKKKVNEIKINIKDTLIKGKVHTKIFKFQSILGIYNLLMDIEPNTQLKLLINYTSEAFYVFKTVNNKKNIYSPYEIGELKGKEIASLFKSFYSDERLQWDDSFLKKSKLMKNAIAPTNFEVKDDYLISDNKYIKVISIEHLGNNANFKDILKNDDCWLSIDLYEIDNKFILNKLAEMKNNNVVEKKFNDFILGKLDSIVSELKKQTIFQCEFKILLYGSNSNYINEQSEIIRRNMENNACVSYIPQESSNTRKLFEKCIYPNLKMGIVHSLYQKRLFKLIGGMANV